MKKFVSFCVAVAVAACGVPAMAQCSSCGGGAPAFSQPVSSYVPQATYSAPVMSQPVYSAPVVSAPVMSAPVYSAPVMSAPVYSSPVVSSPVVSAPVVSSPVVSSGCCGAAPVGGQIIGSPVVSSPVTSGEVISGSSTSVMGLPAGSQIISWEGGTEIQGTIVSDVLVEGGEGSESASAEAENSVDVVEPPAAEETEESPGPDTDETEGET